jgi:hypothetical protein
MVKVFKAVGNRCSRRGAMWCGKAVGHDMGFGKNLEIRRMVLATGCDQIIHWFRVAPA